MKFEEYIDSLKNKSIAVLGIGVSNLPLLNTLAEYNLDLTACDKRSREELGDVASELESKGINLVLGENYLENLTQDVIFRTPGIMPFESHLLKARENGSIITSEMEAFFEVCPCKVIAITGSDGKTTTTTIISELLKAQGYNVHLGGNIGNPLFSDTPKMKDEDFVVLELSSFQLHSMHCIPNVSVITNISPNHLDKHIDYNDYIDAKSSIFINQSSQEKLVLNYANEYSEYYASKTSSDVFYFSRGNKIDKGVYSDDKSVYFINDSIKEKIIDISDIKLIGTHNLENYMAAFAAVHGLVSYENCVQVAKTFSGVEHRLEMVRILNGVTYINDSIGTSPTRTSAGLHALKTKPILIAGGYDKHIPFDGLGDEICQYCKAVFITGATAEKIHSAVINSKYYSNSALKIVMAESFDDAVYGAAKEAVEGDIVLLSPACAAFDSFKNFAERGKYFKKLVNEL